MPEYISITHARVEFEDSISRHERKRAGIELEPLTSSQATLPKPTVKVVRTPAPAAPKTPPASQVSPDPSAGSQRRRGTSTRRAARARASVKAEDFAELDLQDLALINRIVVGNAMRRKKS